MERPILFSAPMVLAAMRGRKSVMRAVCTPQPLFHDGVWHVDYAPADGGYQTYASEDELVREFVPRVSRDCPFGVVGDRLWVRESAYIAPPRFGDADLNNAKDNKGNGRVVGYVASMSAESCRVAEDYGVNRTHASRMPRWASRLTLEVESTRVERLHAIDDADAEREGIRGWSKDRTLWKFAPADREGDGPCWAWTDCPRSAREAFERLWTEDHGSDPWASNPLVWRVAFRVVSGLEVSGG